MDEQFDSETVDTILAFWEREHPGNDHVFMAQQYRALAARLAAAEAALLSNHPESWARITKRLRYERDIARQIARNLLRALRKHEDVPSVDEEFQWLNKE